MSDILKKILDVKTDEVADLIVYLASARAGSISGVDILIDAGLTQTL